MCYLSDKSKFTQSDYPHPHRSLSEGDLLNKSSEKNPNLSLMMFSNEAHDPCCFLQSPEMSRAYSCLHNAVRRIKKNPWTFTQARQSVIMDKSSWLWFRTGRGLFNALQEWIRFNIRHWLNVLVQLYDWSLVFLYIDLDVSDYWPLYLDLSWSWGNQCH